MPEDRTAMPMDSPMVSAPPHGMSIATGTRSEDSS